MNMATERNEYTIELVKSRTWTRQKYYWRVKASNGQILLSSEMYRHQSFARKISKKFADALGCEWKSLV